MSDFLGSEKISIFLFLWIRKGRNSASLMKEEACIECRHRYCQTLCTKLCQKWLFRRSSLLLPMLYQKKNNVLPFYTIFIFFIIKEEASVEYRFDIIDVLLFKKRCVKERFLNFAFFILTAWYSKRMSDV